MSGVEVHDASDLRKYRTEIPNVVLEMGLSPYALTLYIHLKRTAGQNGKCWKATKRLAEEAGMSAGKVSEARAELEERELIALERPKDRTKPVVVTITDVWVQNFEHFRSETTRVHILNTSRSEYEPRKEPLEEGVEANASSAMRQSGNPVALEKHVVDSIYQAMKAAGYRSAVPNSDFGYHLGAAKNMLRNDEPTDAELEELPAAFVRLYEIKGRADAGLALMEMRRQRRRPEVLAANNGSPLRGEPKRYEPPEGRPRLADYLKVVEGRAS